MPAPAHSTPQASTANPANPDQIGKVCTTPPDLRYEATCPASCNLGYTGIQVMADNDANFKCGSDGQWTGSLDCPVVNCPGDSAMWTSKIGSGTVPAECQDPSPQKTYLQECIATCDEGYTRTTDGYVAYPGVTATFTCRMKDASDRGPMGTWTGHMPTDSGLCEGASRDVRCLRWLNIDPTQYRL